MTFSDPPGYPTRRAALPPEVIAVRRLRRMVMLLSLLLLVVALFYAWPMLKGWMASKNAAPRRIAPRGDLMEAERATIQIFGSASPSVVFITTATKRLDLFTRRVTEIPQGTGSGFIWDEQGHIVTNFHVIRGASAATVILSDHTPYPATLVGASPDHDLAVLQIQVPPGTKLTPIPLGTSHDLQVGQFTYAIGNPFGLDQTLTTGVVSALRREITGVAGNQIEDVIQTDAAVNPGNSGGPLLDSAARLIGVNTAIYSPSGSSAGIGFAIPVDTANLVIPQIIKTGSYQRARLPIQADEGLNRRLADAAGLGNVPGVIILAVAPAGTTAGLKGVVQTDDRRLVINDIIQKINGRAVRNVSDLLNALDHVKPGTAVELEVWRDSKTRTVQVPTE